MHQRQFKKGQVLPMSNLFDSIFNNATATVDPVRLMLALLVSLVLGLALSWTYKYRNLYTREFIVVSPCFLHDDPGDFPSERESGDLDCSSRDL